MTSRWNRPAGPKTAIEPTVTIGLRMQYTGSKALHFPRALPGTPESIPRSLLQDVRQDLKSLGMESVLPAECNAHFSALMKHTAEMFWPSLQARQVHSFANGVHQ